jgi:hypothetical protein
MERIRMMSRAMRKYRKTPVTTTNRNPFMTLRRT